MNKKRNIIAVLIGFVIMLIVGYFIFTMKQVTI